MTECFCTDELPCEAHMQVIVAREGASLRTADELTLQFIEDALDTARAESEPIDLAPWGHDVLGKARTALADESWLEDRDLGDELRELANQVESELSGLAHGGLAVHWDDGFLIYRDTRPEVDA